MMGVAFSSSFLFCGGVELVLLVPLDSSLQGRAGLLDEIDGFYELEIDDWGVSVCIHLKNNH